VVQVHRSNYAPPMYIGPTLSGPLKWCGGIMSQKVLETRSYVIGKCPMNDGIIIELPYGREIRMGKDS
jgi:hypothetical protein